MWPPTYFSPFYFPSGYFGGPVTGGALRTLILAAVADVIEGLALDGLTGGVFARKGKRAVAGQTFPCVEVSRGEENDGGGRMGFGYDSPGYPVRVVFLANDPLGSDADTDLYDGWYQSLRRCFEEPEVLRSTVPGVWNVEVRPLPELDPTDESYSRVAGGMTILVRTFEVRGPNA